MGRSGEIVLEIVLVQQEITNLPQLFLYMIWFLASGVTHLISRSADFCIRQGLPL